MTPTYIGDIDLNEETLAHFGVKGMKWGKRKAKLKSDLKWKVGKLKGKALEKKAQLKRGSLNKNLRTINGKVYHTTQNDLEFGGYKKRPGHYTEGYDHSTTPARSLEARYSTTVSRGTEAGRSRKATESYVKSMGNVTGSTRSSSVSVSKPKSSKKQSSYGGGEKWQPRTNAERTAKSNDDFINSKGGQELIKVYKRKKAMSSRKSTKA